MKPFAALIFAIGLWAQTPVATLRLSGSLVNAVTGEPVRRAGIALRYLGGAAGGQPSRIAVSDAGGHFDFGGLAPGRYQLSAERRGFPKQDYAPSEGFAVAEDIPDISFRLRPYAILTGTVLDENGDPIAGAAIQVIESVIVSGKRELRPAISTVTDDRGDYRTASLTAGRYYVSAYAREQESTESTLYPRRFFPDGAELTGAIPLDLEAGGRQRADFRLYPEQAFHIRGQVAGSDQLTGISVKLTPRIAAEGFGGTGFPVSFGGQGRFDIAGVTPGSYVITASGIEGFEMRAVSQVVSVGAANLEGVTLAPAPGAAISGHVAVEEKEGTAALPLERIAISLLPEDSITRPVLAVQLGADRTFKIPQAAAGNYTLRVTVPEPYYLKSAASGGVDIVAGPLGVPLTGAVAPLEVAIGSNGGQVIGTVSVQDKPASNCMVLLNRRGSAGTSQDKWTETDASGKFVFSAVAPGEYIAYAWRDALAVEYRNPQVLAQYSGAGVTVSEGGKQTVELKLNGN